MRFMRGASLQSPEPGAAVVIRMTRAVQVVNLLGNAVFRRAAAQASRL